jgi:hypothetical protein
MAIDCSRPAPFSQAVEIIAGRYYLTILKHPDSISRSPAAAASVCYCIDADLVRACVCVCCSCVHATCVGLSGQHQHPYRRHSSHRALHIPQLYEPFYADFGPLNLGKTYRFCELTARLLAEAEQRGKRVFLYCGPQPQQRANAAVLVRMHNAM